MKGRSTAMMEPNIPPADKRPPINFNPHHSQPTTKSAAPLAWSAEDAVKALGASSVDSNDEGSEPNASLQLAMARLQGSNTAPPRHADPFNPTPPIPHTTQEGIVTPPIGADSYTPDTRTHLPLPPVPSPADLFLKGRARVTLELADGTFILPVIAVRDTALGVFLFLPNSEDTVSFIPRPGTELKVTFREDGVQHTRSVYYPGTHVLVEELSMIVIAMVKQE